MMYILANPHSGDKSGLSKAEWIRDHYPAYPVTIFQTEAADDEFRKIAAILKDYEFNKDSLIVIGGDGTLAKVLQVWPESQPLAYLPAGSGNDFARDIGRQSVEELIEAIENQEIAEIYLFQSENHLLLNSLGLGFDAHIIKQTENSHLKTVLNFFHLGKLTYLVFGIRSIFRRQGISVRLVDEKGQSEEFSDIFLFVLANTAYFGGGIMVWPQASSKTSQLDLIYLKKGSLYHRVAGLLTLIFKQHHRSKRLHHKEYSSLMIECPQPTLAQINGESIKVRQETFSCQKRRLYVRKD